MKDTEDKFAVEEALGETGNTEDKDQFQHNFIQLKPCPRCGNKTGNKKIKRRGQKDKSAYAEIHCSNCGLVITGKTETDAVREWNRTKESRIEYAIKLLNEYGNAYIGEKSKEEWETHDIISYLSKRTGKKIKVYQPKTFESGIIARAEKMEDENNAVHIHIEGTDDTNDKNLKTILADSVDYKTVRSGSKAKNARKTPTQIKKPAKKKRSPYKKDYPSVMKAKNKNEAYENGERLAHEKQKGMILAMDCYLKRE